MGFSYPAIHRIFAVLFFLICVGIVFYSRELGQFRGFIGDIVIVMFLYSLVQGIYRFNPGKLILALLLLAFFIEMLQYFHFVIYMGWEKNQAMNLIFGSVYDPIDIIAYTIGGILIVALDLTYIKKETPIRGSL
ncbi:DUF2809 domain-containing protein [Candidatus Gracilibacteria bacterium]|nr:DUF2809 domain-containing protein [Candidatus Gracilibacteria bacterium]